MLYLSLTQSGLLFLRQLPWSGRTHNDWQNSCLLISYLTCHIQPAIRHQRKIGLPAVRNGSPMLFRHNLLAIALPEPSSLSPTVHICPELRSAPGFRLIFPRQTCPDKEYFAQSSFYPAHLFQKSATRQTSIKQLPSICKTEFFFSC